jgi:hypothetical protein
MRTSYVYKGYVPALPQQESEKKSQKGEILGNAVHLARSTLHTPPLCAMMLATRRKERHGQRH